MIDTKIPWFKNPFIISFIGMFFCLLILMGQCSTGNKLTTIQKQNAELIKSTKENTQAIKEFNDLVKLQIEYQFTQNLLYSDQLNRKQLSTQDFINKLESLNKKISVIKNK